MSLDAKTTEVHSLVSKCSESLDDITGSIMTHSSLKMQSKEMEKAVIKSVEGWCDKIAYKHLDVFKTECADKFEAAAEYMDEIKAAWEEVKEIKDHCAKATISLQAAVEVTHPLHVPQFMLQSATHRVCFDCRLRREKLPSTRPCMSNRWNSTRYFSTAWNCMSPCTPSLRLSSLLKAAWRMHSASWLHLVTHPHTSPCHTHQCDCSSCFGRRSSASAYSCFWNSKAACSTSVFLIFSIACHPCR